MLFTGLGTPSFVYGKGGVREEILRFYDDLRLFGPFVS